MTQIWPGWGVAPVPILLSVIFKPDGVVMVFPTDWAVAVPGAPVNKTTANAMTKASATRALAREKARITVLLGIDRVRASGLFTSTRRALPLLFSGAASNSESFGRAPHENRQDRLRS